MKIVEHNYKADIQWINPVGGLGDTLMLSGVLKHVVDANPAAKFNLVIRTKYSEILKGHPAIADIGHPLPGAKFVEMNYWDQSDYCKTGTRVYQILAAMFGLKTPVEESLYVPWEMKDDPMLMSAIPWKKRNVLICPSSDSPRKQMPAQKWEALVKMFLNDGTTVAQVGKRNDRYIRGAYSLLGMTTPRQIIAMIRHFDTVVTSDNFLMHAAHLCGIPAVVLWGATDHRMYGYHEHTHLQTVPACAFSKGCIGPGRGKIYSTECPEGGAHCMNQLNVKTIYEAVGCVIDKNTT